MELFFSLLSFLQKSISTVGPFLLLLGLLIFIHELGHFLVARYFGVKVEIFSLGFGPKIFKYKRGDTVYCISLLPLGGYVKMFGDNPLEEVPDSEKAKGFLYKRVHEKWLIAFGGPFMNLIFTVWAFFLLAAIGLPSLPPILGDIGEDTTAYTAGFRSGDIILSANGKDISYYEDLNEIIKNKANEKLSFKVKSQTNEIKIVSTTISQVKNPNLLEWKEAIGAIDGLSPASAGLRIGVVYNSPAHKAGLKTFDKIEKANGKDLKYWRELESFIQSTESPALSLTVKRKSETRTLTLELLKKDLQKSFLSLSALGIEPAYLYIERVGKDTPAYQAGLLPGDRLVSINENPLENWRQVLEAVQSYSNSPFFIKYHRQGIEKTIQLSAKPLFVEGNIKKKFMLGIVSGGREVLPEPVTRKRSFFQASAYSGQETGKWLGFITMGLVRLTQGKISLRTMGGPVMIGREAYRSFHRGFQDFLFIMALISLNLFFLNLLPIPLLDGGHILFFTLEGLLGRPLSVKKLLIAQKAGLLLLVSFISFVIFNDIYNWLKAW